MATTAEPAGTTTKQFITIRCTNCKTWNRIDAAKAGNGPKCGNCKTPVALDHPVLLDDESFDRVINGTDIPVLVEHLLRKHRREGERTRSLSREAVDLLSAYAWPGNVRELENEIERLLVLGSDQEIIPAELISPRILQAVPEGTKRQARQVHSGRLNDMVENLEREVIRAGLERTGYNKSRLARELGISRSNLILKISRYGLEPATSSDDESATA